jgi:hypothetical protein
MIRTPFPTFDKRVIIFAGAYGSGKTEVAVNYAQGLATSQTQPVSIIDLDIVNPYFRSREAAFELEAQGVHVIMPHNEMCHADLPIILPEIRGEIERSDGKVVVDVGGDDVGARVMSSMADAFTPEGYEFWIVLNARRPFTSDVAGSLKMMRDIEISSRLKFTGIVSNTHLIGETTPEVVTEGYQLAEEVGKAAEIPVVFVSVVKEVAQQLDPNVVKVAVFALSRQMLKPWEERAKVVRGL